VKSEKSLLAEGIEALCQNDKEIKRLIAPRINEIMLLLECYIKEIELFNSAYGLVAVKNTNELVIRHILDSIAPLGIICCLLAQFRHPENEYKIADAGSGAGLPGIPLAITLPNCNFSLIERMRRRAGFLHNTKAVLGINNITIEEDELEVLLRRKTEKRRFPLITFRAFKPLQPKLLETFFSACTEEGLIAVYKGKREKIEAEMLQFKEEYCQCEIVQYKTPFLEEERHILIIRRNNRS
jgi:16S rRNA (guanine527-N7)-methyltransferase